MRIIELHIPESPICSLGLTLCPVQNILLTEQRGYLLLFLEFVTSVSFIILGVGQSEVCLIMLISKPAFCQSCELAVGFLPTPFTLFLPLERVNL